MIKYKTGNELSLLNMFTESLPFQDGSDSILQVKNYVENLDADAALLSAKHCSDVRGFSVFFLGGMLKAIRDNEWFKEDGYPSFKAMVEEDVGLSRSTAYDYIKIYSCLTESGVSWDQIKHIGWTKIRWFAKHLTKENVDEWIKEAEGKNVEELRQFVKQETASAADKAISPTYIPSAMTEVSTQVDIFPNEDAANESNWKESNAPTLVTEASALDTAHIRQFKLYPEQEAAVNQALDHVKEELQTEHNGVALEGVCIAYLRDCT